MMIYHVMTRALYLGGHNVLWRAQTEKIPTFYGGGKIKLKSNLSNGYVNLLAFIENRDAVCNG